jgi:hypothetical protein
MIAFGGIDVVLHVAARGRTGGPEKFHSSTAKDFFLPNVCFAPKSSTLESKTIICGTPFHSRKSCAV